MSVKTEDDPVHSEMKCPDCGQKGSLSKRGKFVCDSPISIHCEYKGLVQELCGACCEYHPIEWGHRYCDVCGDCFDDEDPCVLH